MRVIIGIIGLLVVVGLAYVRLAPSDVARWHKPIDQSVDTDIAYGAVRVFDAGDEDLARADAYMRDLPRTQVLAGSVKKGRITYVTRSRIFGFPDYTTLEADDDRIKAFARLRFGKSDMGVNRERLEGLVAALQ